MTDDAEEETVEETEVESEDDAAKDAEAEQAGLQNGDFVRLEYTVRTVEDGTVVDTTSREVAEEAGIDEEDYDFSPRTIVVGAGHVFESVDHALVGAEESDTETVSIPAAEAFGEFDPDDVRTVSVDKIDEDDRYPGAQVQIDGEQGHLETVIGGRARVDFNHPLAGENLEYEYEVVDVVEDRLEQARGMLGIYLQEVPDLRIETAEVEEEVEVEVDPHEDDEDAAPAAETETQVVEKETLYIDATPQMTMNQRWLFQKQQIAGQLIARIGVDRVVVEEVLDGGSGMMGGMGGMMGGMGGGGAAEDVEEALAEADIDADEIVEEIESADE
jgi:FKBP-type peptidyl-prolyl cis-trans isomerase SlyD